MKDTTDQEALHKDRLNTHKAVVELLERMKLEKEWEKYRSNGKELALNRDTNIGFNQALTDAIQKVDELFGVSK